MWTRKVAKSPGREAAKTAHQEEQAIAAGTAKDDTPHEDDSKKKFVSVVRDAEKSVLVFNLDLGRVPIMNMGTIVKKVTEDITIVGHNFR